MKESAITTNVYSLFSSIPDSNDALALPIPCKIVTMPRTIDPMSSEHVGYDVHWSRYDFVFSLEHIVLANRVPDADCLRGLSGHPTMIEQGTHQSQMYQRMRSNNLMERCGLRLLDIHVLSTPMREMHSA